jgi:hypothetical protein
VEHSVQDENFQFAGGGVSKEVSIALRDLNTNRDITTFFTWKGEYICGLVLATKTPVELLDPPASGDEDRHITGYAGKLLCTRGKASQGLLAHSTQGWLEDDHGSQKESGGLLALPLEFY